MSFWGNLQICPICLSTFIKPHTKSALRIGPHDHYIESIIVGSLLGDSYAERRYNGTRICFQQESKTVEYLHKVWEVFSDSGYCSLKKPVAQKRVGISKDKYRFVYRFKTWTFQSFNFYHNLFYVNKLKIIPKNIEFYLTPLAIAIWIMDDGTKSSGGLRLCTNSFSYEDNLLLCKALKNRYNITATTILIDSNQYNVRIHSASMATIARLVKPYYRFSQNKIDFDKYSLRIDN